MRPTRRSGTNEAVPRELEVTQIDKPRQCYICELLQCTHPRLSRPTPCLTQSHGGVDDSLTGARRKIVSFPNRKPSSSLRQYGNHGKYLEHVALAASPMAYTMSNIQAPGVQK